LLNFGPNGPVVIFMTIGRPKEFEFDEALEAALEVFWKKGYEATSLQDLIEAMGLSKSSFYQTFESKHKLLQSCIKRYQDIITKELTDSLENAKSGRSFIEGAFSALAEKAKSPCDHKGCLIMNCANEFAQKDPTVADLISKATKKTTDIFLMAIKRAQKEGEVSSDKKPLPIARYLVSNICGVQTMIKAGANPAVIKEINEVALQALD
jgi:TetR/AcrR family transcriptional regulator, transcriptional repressor for nem operon